MTKLGHSYIRISFYSMAMTVLLSMFLWRFDLTDGLSLVSEYGHFFIIGLFAATIANATGAGGGIVFLPAFVLLGLSVPQALATSFAIQCFGMTSGTLTWLALARRESRYEGHCWGQLNSVLWLTLPAAWAGLLLAQNAMPTPPFNVHYLFSAFSIVIGLLMLYRLRHTDKTGSPSLNIVQKTLIVVSSFIGGIITWWLSIGVGEILAIVLLMVGFNIRFSITVAVIVSAASVWLALPHYLNLADTINYKVLLFAAPAALFGGFIARHLAVAISAVRLKMALSLWIILSGLLYLLLPH
ncbi:MAG: sulfite exporter TauE/SafE family protein [Psychrosphaera sp.]|nr:sulfite exporter TauE/SafE family protein [Psychrosphaera sp.]